MRKLAVAETFYSIQGEGRTMGVPSVFLRLGGCNLLCGGHNTDIDKQLHGGATWRCDTIEVWKKSRAMTCEALLSELDVKYGFRKMIEEDFVHLIITGGEPLLQQDAILGFIQYMQDEGIIPVIEIETNGTILPSERLDREVDYWNVSPKLSNSGVSYNERINLSSTAFFCNNDRSIFKFVVSSEKDWDEINNFIQVTKTTKDKIWLMPAASNQEELSRVSKLIAEICMAGRFNFSSRLQVAIWNETVGV